MINFKIMDNDNINLIKETFRTEDVHNRSDLNILRIHFEKNDSYDMCNFLVADPGFPVLGAVLWRRI